VDRVTRFWKNVHFIYTGPTKKDQSLDEFK
jgi:hypothetical protein